MDGLQVAQTGEHLPEALPQVAWEGKYDPNQGYITYATPSPVYSDTPDNPKKILGLRRSTFIVVVILIIAVIGGAVGGGVGGSIAVKKAYDPQRQRDIVDVGPVGNGLHRAPATDGSLQLDCPNLDSAQLAINTKSKQYRFNLRCGIDNPSPAGGKDITVLIAYTLQDCLRSCAALNDQAEDLGVSCVGVQFNADLGVWLQREGGNCWLKREITGALSTGGNNHVSGTLSTE
ncbi:unnamed protein product [Parascedosporium putredinis]|uniref:Apple domain-containing protein n=1 Tax=Parascedosporium putredinis TaxID=1442378 RepID=A0A9P1H3H8_9PEZI|nr:unnamed protein product [Parascedosporium putredinis]CAI7997037.1 unnamed protein product [Parascedosporium putredinis]